MKVIRHSFLNSHVTSLRGFNHFGGQDLVDFGGRIVRALKDLGHDARGIRLDSGDLAELSKGCKKLIRETAERYGHDFSHM